jgi:hypothetical protein
LGPWRRQGRRRQAVSGVHHHDGAVTMVESKKVLLIAPDGNKLAELLIAGDEEGWLTGTVVWQNFPFEIKKALAWYDEVVRDQMLSYLDEAIAAVQRLELQARFADGSTHKTYSLHVSPSNEVSFRISPVLPPPESPMVVLR